MINSKLTDRCLGVARDTSQINGYNGFEYIGNDIFTMTRFRDYICKLIIIFFFFVEMRFNYCRDTKTVVR